MSMQLINGYSLHSSFRCAAGLITMHVLDPSCDANVGIKDWTGRIGSNRSELHLVAIALASDFGNAFSRDNRVSAAFVSALRSTVLSSSPSSYSFLRVRTICWTSYVDNLKSLAISGIAIAISLSDAPSSNSFRIASSRYSSESLVFSTVCSFGG